MSETRSRTSSGPRGSTGGAAISANRTAPSVRTVSVSNRRGELPSLLARDLFGCPFRPHATPTTAVGSLDRVHHRETNGDRNARQRGQFRRMRGRVLPETAETALKSLRLNQNSCLKMVDRLGFGSGERDRSAMSLIAEEIHDQPRAWSRAARAGTRERGAARRRADRGDRLRQLLACGEGAGGAARAERRRRDRRVRGLGGLSGSRLRPRRRDLALGGDDRDPPRARARPRRHRHRRPGRRSARARSPRSAISSSI